MSIRSELRVKEWKPAFIWVSSIKAVADAINRPHEDYPHRVAVTAKEVERLGELHLPSTAFNLLLVEVHRAVFWDADFKGTWKDIDVLLRPNSTTVTKVADWMKRLEQEYQDRMTNIDSLLEWYLDFETIHPFPDGNGRVGGIIVAVYSY